MGDPFEGSWLKGDIHFRIHRDQLIWDNGEVDELNRAEPGLILIVREHGSYRARLSPDELRLVWSNGSIWHRPGEAMPLADRDHGVVCQPDVNRLSSADQSAILDTSIIAARGEDSREELADLLSAFGVPASDSPLVLEQEIATATQHNSLDTPMLQTTCLLSPTGPLAYLSPSDRWQQHMTFPRVATPDFAFPDLAHSCSKLSLASRSQSELTELDRAELPQHAFSRTGSCTDSFSTATSRSDVEKDLTIVQLQQQLKAVTSAYEALKQELNRATGVPSVTVHPQARGGSITPDEDLPVATPMQKQCEGGVPHIRVKLTELQAQAAAMRANEEVPRIPTTPPRPCPEDSAARRSTPRRSQPAPPPPRTCAGGMSYPARLARQRPAVAAKPTASRTPSSGRTTPRSATQSVPNSTVARLLASTSLRGCERRDAPLMPRGAAPRTPRGPDDRPPLPPFMAGGRVPMPRTTDPARVLESPRKQISQSPRRRFEPVIVQPAFPEAHPYPHVRVSLRSFS